MTMQKTLQQLCWLIKATSKHIYMILFVFQPACGGVRENVLGRGGGALCVGEGTDIQGARANALPCTLFQASIHSTAYPVAMVTYRWGIPRVT